MWETDRDRQNRLLYWPITSSLDHTILYYLQTPFSTSYAFRVEYSTGALSEWKLALTHIASNWFQLNLLLTWYLHISFHNAHDFQSTMWLLLLVYMGASCSETSLIDSLVKGHYTILRRVLKICGDLLSPRLLWNTTSGYWCEKLTRSN